MDAGDLLHINMSSRTLAEKLRRIADRIDEHGEGRDESATSAVLILHQHDGLSRVFSLGCGAHEALGAIAVGNHILLNAVMPLGNQTEGK